MDTSPGLILDIQKMPEVSTPEVGTPVGLSLDDMMGHKESHQQPQSFIQKEFVKD